MIEKSPTESCMHCLLSQITVLFPFSLFPGGFRSGPGRGREFADVRGTEDPFFRTLMW